MALIDLESVKERADLLAICGADTALRKVAASGGGEWAGPCPFCGGRDRFRVQPAGHPGRWLCRHCTAGKWDTVIGYIARRENLDPTRRADLEEICRLAVGGDLPTLEGAAPVQHQPAYSPPAFDWQAAAGQVISECEAALWAPKYQAILDYLRGRGLQDETIKRFRLGYCATGSKNAYGRKIAGLWVPRGIVIPCIVAGEAWYLKIRLMPGVPVICGKCKADLAGPGDCPRCGESNKYRGVKGNRPAAIFNAENLRGADAALFCEGEFDCMIAHQELNDVLACVTLGSSTNRPDLAAWGAYLVPLRVIFAAYDTDQAGEEGAAAMSDLLKRVRRLPLPAGMKDINDFYQAGGDLWEWIKPHLEENGLTALPKLL